MLNLHMVPREPELPSIRVSQSDLYRPWRGLAVVVGLLSALVLALTGYGFFASLGRRGTSQETLRSTPTILMSVRDIARLETTEMHIEKVVDLSDKQNRFFGLIETTDAILLVASGDVTVGVDLAKINDGDLAVDPATGVGKIVLPEPEIFSTRLDEQHTYVYKRSTGVLAERNEQLESRARRQAVHAIEDAAHETDVFERSKRQAERQLSVLLERLGVSRVDIQWRTSS